jgi:putative oxidoreductase
LNQSVFNRLPADGGALLARLLLGAIFVWSGFGKAAATSATIAGFTKLGLPVPVLAYAISVAVELGVGAIFILGLWTRPAALVLGFWCIATAMVAHSNFADRNMLIHFYKNVGMCGGFIYAAIAGAGAFSVDGWLATTRGKSTATAHA